MAQLSTSIRHICSKFRAAQSTGAVLPAFISDRRGASTATASAATSAEEEVVYERKKLTLYRHLSRPGNWNESAVKVIKDWSREGKKLTKTNLEKAVEKLRKYGRYKHALEVSEWMDGSGGLRLGLSDLAIRLDLIARVRGIDDAEKYFINLPERAMNHKSYGALLNCYVREELVEKAEGVMEKMKELDFVLNAVPYNNMMTLYFKTGQPEKVPLVIQEMKANDVVPDTFTYNIWMKSCAAMSGIGAVEKVLDEMKRDGRVGADWTTYSNLAAIYVDAGIVAKAESALKEMEKRMPQKKLSAYTFLITMYAGIHSTAEVHRVWGMIRQRFSNMTNTSYICMLSSLVKLGDMQGAEKCFEEWESDGLSYDTRVPNVLIDAYITKGMIEKAESFLEHALEKGGKPNFKTWEMFVDGYLENKQMNRAIETMKKAISKVKNREWQPAPEKALAILKHFEELGDVDDAEDIFKRLRSVDHVNTDTYNSLLRTYIQAGKSPSKVLRRMKLDKIVPDMETDRLLRQIGEFEL